MKESKIKSKAGTSTADDNVLKRIEQSRQLLDRLKATQPKPPVYASSILQSAIHDKSRVLEALLSTISDNDQRYFQLSDTNEFGRNAVAYAAIHGNLESLELLAAADASFNRTDMFFRTALHYAAMNDSSKVIEAVFMAFKAAGKPVSIYG